MEIVDEKYKLAKKKNNGIVYAFYWHLSMYLVRFFSYIHLSPNLVSTFSLIFYVIAGYYFYLGGYINNLSGGVFLFLGVLMDCTDGKLARMDNKTSNLGIWLDYNYDYIRPLFVYPPISIALYRESGELSVVYLAFIAIVISSVYTITLMRWKQFPFASVSKKDYVEKSSFHVIFKQFYFLEGIEPLAILFFAFTDMMLYFLLAWTCGLTLIYLVSTFAYGYIIFSYDRDGH